MILIKCPSCKKIVDFLQLDKQASYDWLRYWLSTDNHYCAQCWLKKHQNKAIKQLEHKADKKADIMQEMAPWPYDDPQNQDGWGYF